MEPNILIPRLLLTRLTDTDPDSQHLQWFYKNCSDEDAMARSLHGPCTSIEESREWMIKAVTEYNNMFYAVFLLRAPIDDTSTDDLETARGEYIGTVNLRLECTPVFPPPPRPSNTDASTTSTPKPDNVRSTVPKFRVLGYQLFKPFCGKGYATEANAALIQAYKIFVRSKGESGFIEAHIDLANKDSVRVAEKLGLQKIGSKGYKETVDIVQMCGYGNKLRWVMVDGKKTAKLWYVGAFREPGFSVYGKWV